MDINTSKTVRDLAVEMPNATRLFERLGIDYCCGGKKPLGEACTAAGLDVNEVIRTLQNESVPSSVPAHDLQSGSLAELIDHIVQTHHKFTREETSRIKALLDKVCSAHGKNHPELLAIHEVFSGLARELALHLMKEENVLFPYIVRMEEAVLQNDPVLPPPFGTVQNPIRMMMQEHDGAGVALQQIREHSNRFQTPDDACFSYKTLFQALAGFEADLHQHIHLENNILFPQAAAMEDSVAASAR